MIKWVLNEQSYDKLGPLSIEREDLDYCIYMLYSEEFIKSIVENLGGSVDSIERDSDFEEFDNSEIDVFKKHIKFYKENFEIVSLKEGLKILKSNLSTKKKYLSITFDDTLSSFLIAIKHMKKFSIKPTIFLNSDPLILKKPLFNHKNLLTYEFWWKNKNYNISTLRSWYQKIINSNENVYQNKTFHKFILTKYLNKKNIKILIKKKLIDLGSHTSNHSVLNNKSYDQQYILIAKSHKELESFFNQKIQFFSFPFGKKFHRNSDSERIASKISKYSFSCSGGINIKIINRPLKRIGVHNENIDNLHDLLTKQ